MKKSSLPPEELQELLDRLAQATTRTNMAREVYERENEHLKATVREAFSLGVPAGPIMDSTGLSDSRLYQIRDGK
jgi:hypothetical protein